MNVERQQGITEQMSLFEQVGSVIRPVDFGDAGSGSETHEEQQAFTAVDQQRALTQDLMERVVLPSNLNTAYKRVKANKGSAGIDGMTVEQLSPWLAQHKGQLIEQLVTGTYKPQLIRGVQIAKATGGVRQLGIPTVVDRLIQQAILQVLEPIMDAIFSAGSHGFRPGRSAHTALKQAQGHVAAGHAIVVDMDLEKFFDRVNHDMLMSRLHRWIGDKRLLRIIRRFLEAGMFQYGVKIRRVEGTPQGGPLSPLLANLLLDDLDKELERRGHRFCRYADDCNIYVDRSEFVATREDSLLLVIDIQQAMLRVIDRWETVAGKTEQLIQSANVLEVPILFTEQYKKGLGETLSELIQGNRISAEYSKRSTSVPALKRISFQQFNHSIGKRS
jgi:RNA-directed DNA polymerase